MPERRPFGGMGWALLTVAVMIFAGWGRDRAVQPWRKIAALLVAALLIIEASAQLLAFAGILPGIHRMNGRNLPYGRVYYNEEGLGNGPAAEFLNPKPRNFVNGDYKYFHFGEPGPLPSDESLKITVRNGLAGYD